MADLNSLLKSKLNISDAPVMMAGAAAPAPAASAPVEVFVVIDGLVMVLVIMAGATAYVGDSLNHTISDSQIHVSSK